MLTKINGGFHMTIWKTEYETISNELLEKIAPLYEIHPWDDPFNDTTYGSPELDELVYEAQHHGTADEVTVIKLYTEALYAESKITVFESCSELVWEEKIKAAKLLLERIDPFVNVVLAYHKRIYS